MRTFLFSLTFIFGSVILAQNPPASPPTTTTDPTGNPCVASSVLNYVPSGQLYTCKGGVYAKVPADAVSINGAAVPVSAQLAGTNSKGQFQTAYSSNIFNTKYLGMYRWLGALANLSIPVGSQTPRRPIWGLYLGDSVGVGNGAAAATNGFIALMGDAWSGIGTNQGGFLFANATVYPRSPLTQSGTWTADGTGPFGVGTVCANNSATLSSSVSGSNVFDVLYETNSTTAAWGWVDTLGASGSFGGSSVSPQFQFQSFATSSNGNRTVTLTAPSGTSTQACFIGIRTTNTANGASGGATMLNFSIFGKKASDAVSGAHTLDWIPVLNPDLFGTDLAINDSGITPIGTYTTDITQILQAALNGGSSVFLTAPNPLCPQSRTVALQPYIAAQLAVGASLQIPVVDIFDRWGGSCASAVIGGQLNPVVSLTISTMSWVNGFVTATTTASHKLLPGYAVTIAGVSPSGYNAGPITVYSTPTPTTFTYLSPASIGTYVSGGTVAGADGTHPNEEGHWDYWQAHADALLPYQPMNRMYVGLSASMTASTPIFGAKSLFLSGTGTLDGTGQLLVSHVGDGLFTSPSYSYQCIAGLVTISGVGLGIAPQCSPSGPGMGIQLNGHAGDVVRWFAWGY